MFFSTGGKFIPIGVSKTDKSEEPMLLQIMAQLKVILDEQRVCSGKMDEMQKQLKKQEDRVKYCTIKIQTVEVQNERLLRENVELKARLLGLKDHPQENNECAQGTSGTAGDDVIAVVETLGNALIQDYYWKEYVEEIPKEALPGGTDSHGNITYIGQTISKGHVLPGNLNATMKILFYAMCEKQNTRVRNIKVLCVHTPEAYEWVRTNIRDIRFLNHRHLVAGGHGNDSPYFIGRTVYQNQVVVGKIYHEKFAYATEDKVYYIESNFEVLVYKSGTPAKVTIT